MPKAAAKVGVNGFGVIGKRVADAVSKQNDMKLVGVSDVVGDYRVKLGEMKGYQIYASVPEKLPDMKKAGVEVAGTLEELLRKIDVIVDCTPAGLGAKNKASYDKAGVKSIFQGGEKPSVSCGRKRDRKKTPFTRRPPAHASLQGRRTIPGQARRERAQDYERDGLFQGRDT